ncbi:unnamed protein product [Parajaminaea phylloscopi]
MAATMSPQLSHIEDAWICVNPDPPTDPRKPAGTPGCWTAACTLLQDCEVVIQMARDAHSVSMHTSKRMLYLTTHDMLERLFKVFAYLEATVDDPSEYVSDIYRSAATELHSCNMTLAMASAQLPKFREVCEETEQALLHEIARTAADRFTFSARHEEKGPLVVVNADPSCDPDSDTDSDGDSDDDFDDDFEGTESIPSSANTTITENTDVDVHARPRARPVAHLDYDVDIDIDLDLDSSTDDGEYSESADGYESSDDESDSGDDTVIWIDTKEIRARREYNAARARALEQQTWAAQSVYYEARDDLSEGLTATQLEVYHLRARIGGAPPMPRGDWVLDTPAIDDEDYRRRIEPLAWFYWTAMDELRARQVKAGTYSPTQQRDNGNLTVTEPINLPPRLSFLRAGQIQRIWQDTTGIGRLFFAAILRLGVMEDGDEEEARQHLAGFFPLLAYEDELREALARLIMVLQP